MQFVSAGTAGQTERSHQLTLIHNRRTILFFMLVSMILLATACTTVTYESYRPVQNPNVDIVYVGSGADFSKYRRLMNEEMGIYFPTDAPPGEADLERVRSAFREAFLEQVSAYEIVTRPAPDVMKVRASLVDLRRAVSTDLPELGADVNKILEPGKLTFMIEMRDSATNRLLLRAADTEKSPKIDLPEDGTGNTDAVYAAAKHWAVLFRNFLDQNLDHAP
ncbi:MAG: DUF3313 family protein [Woeseia sp.]